MKRYDRDLVLVAVIIVVMLVIAGLGARRAWVSYQRDLTIIDGCAERAQ